MTARMDVSGVPRQGGYITKMCPVVIQNRMLGVPEIAVEAPDAEMRMQQGIDFEHALVESVGAEAGWHMIPATYADQAITMTCEAMEARVPVIQGGWLPHDDIGRRTGKPDLLVFAGDGYVPVDIKHRKTLAEAEGSMRVSDLVAPSPRDAYDLVGHKLRKNEGDGLQLAHYRRLLEASGQASQSTLAGIVGKELRVVWYDLDEPMWTTPSTSDPARRTKVRSTLDVYDFEYGWRLDIAATALAHLDDPTVPLLVEPMWCGECAGCGFLDHCLSTLENGSGDVSRIPGNEYSHWRTLRNHGIKERSQVAALHYPTADLSRQAVDVQWFLDAASELPDSTLVSTLRPRATKQLGALEAAGIRTVADLSQLDPLTASLGGFIASQILNARAIIGDAPVYRRPGKTEVTVPRADVEIDIDMESMNEGVYLWGVLVTDHVGSGVFEEGYRGFTTWQPLDEVSEQVPLLEMLDWLDRQRAMARDHDLTIKAYVWYEGAENTQLRRIAGNAGPEVAERVENLIQSESWVDLMKVFTGNWMTGGSTSLKVIAPLAGFSWPVDDPGGGMAMVKYNEAVLTDSEDARQWILDYNRGDVEATLAIREWLDVYGATWPEVATN